jgi:hypothetical protein
MRHDLKFGAGQRSDVEVHELVRERVVYETGASAGAGRNLIASSVIRLSAATAFGPSAAASASSKGRPL